ncbi:MAG: hypothetical protein E7070_08560 [Bacteroidales bacterium]|nr:hypothetical protein [Bacteroidales bacterium]
MYIRIPLIGVSVIGRCDILWVNYIHIGVGFEVAYLYGGGKFEGQDCEIGSKYGSHAYFILCSHYRSTHFLAGGRENNGQNPTMKQCVATNQNTYSPPKSAIGGTGGLFRIHHDDARGTGILTANVPRQRKRSTF